MAPESPKALLLKLHNFPEAFSCQLGFGRNSNLLLTKTYWMMYENRVSGTTRVCTGLTRRPFIPVALADRGAQTTFSKTLHRRDTHISLQRISFAKATTYQKGKLMENWYSDYIGYAITPPSPTSQDSSFYISSALGEEGYPFWYVPVFLYWMLHVSYI